MSSLSSHFGARRIPRFFFIVPFLFFFIAMQIYAGDGAEDEFRFELTTLVRGYYLGDERIQWSGVEDSFAAEAVLVPRIKKKIESGEFFAKGEFYLNQRYGDNILMDDLRRRWKANFEVDTFDISQLCVGFARKGLTIRVGKVATPFGKIYVDTLTNSRMDAPFIRAEAILWRETGVFATYRTGCLVLDAGLINGESERDTNSDKGGVARVGLEGETWAVGVSGKLHDGIGSEQQKEYKNHNGVDVMLKHGAWTLSGEYIYDEYGFHREFDESDIFWERSLYYRDIFYKTKTPITGRGGYINVTYRKGAWTVHLNYGAYEPDRIGNPLHDDPNKRGFVKVLMRPDPNVRIYGMVLLENDRERESWQRGAEGYAILAGAEFSFRSM